MKPGEKHNLSSAILAIEAESRNEVIEQVRRAPASLDNDELRIPRDGNGVAKDPGNLSDYQRGYLDGFDAPANTKARAASLDSDELRSVLRVVAGDRHRALGHLDFFADCAAPICKDLRALLSAGDKAAPGWNAVEVSAGHVTSLEVSAGDKAEAPLDE